MKLIRCSAHKKRNSFKFLELEEVYAVGEVLEKQVWFDHFERKGGISPRGITRFGPQGLAKWPLYASEHENTCYYEFSYWKLKEWKSELGMPTRTSLLQFDFRPQGTPIDVRALPDYERIMDKYSYQYSHQWVLGLEKLPEFIVYPSVRDPSTQYLNFALYDERGVSNVVMLKEVTMVVLDEKTVEVIFSDKMRVVVRPIK